MITYQKTNAWQTPVLIAVIACAVVGAGVYMLAGRGEPDATTQVDAGASAPVMASTQPTTTSQNTNMAPSAPTLLADGRPSDVAPGVWNALNKAVANKPQLKPEVEKVISYMRFQRSFEYWQSLENTRDVQQRRQLGQSMLDEMPARLSKGEFTMSEALMMVAALMSDLEPDEKRREQQIEEWSRKLAAVSPQPADDAQLQEIQKRTEDRRIVPGLLMENPNPDQAQLEKALEERMRIAP